VDNALWDLYARARQKPLWKLIVDMSPVCLRTANARYYGILINVPRRNWSSRPRSDILLMRSRLMRHLLSSRQEKRQRRSARPSCVHKGERTLRYCLPAFFINARLRQIPCLRDVCRLARYVFLDGMTPPRMARSISDAILIHRPFLSLSLARVL
jgi:hypothetical protein